MFKKVRYPEWWINIISPVLSYSGICNLGQSLWHKYTDMQKSGKIAVYGHTSKINLETESNVDHNYTCGSLEIYVYL